MALTFTRHLLLPLEGTEIKAALDFALQKAMARIPPPAMELVRQLEQSFSVGLGPHKRYREHRLTIDLLTKAITRARTVQMRYFSASRNAASRREIDPYRLRYVAGGLYLIAYCHWRKGVPRASGDEPTFYVSAIWTHEGAVARLDTSEQMKEIAG